MSNSNDSKIGNPPPLDYCEPEKPQRLGGTHFGYIALGFAAAHAVPIVWWKVTYLQKDPRDVRYQISNYEFDYGFFFLLMILLFAILGAFQRRRSRIASGLAIVTLVLSWVLVAITGP